MQCKIFNAESSRNYDFELFWYFFLYLNFRVDIENIEAYSVRKLLV